MDNNNMGGGMMKHSMDCPCPHHKIVPIAIILIGLFALLGTMGVLSGTVVGYVWPILLIVIGVMKLMGKKCKCCKAM